MNELIFMYLIQKSGSKEWDGKGTDCNHIYHLLSIKKTTNIEFYALEASAAHWNGPSLGVESLSFGNSESV